MWSRIKINPKGCTLHDSICSIFLKWRNCGNGEKIDGFQGFQRIWEWKGSACVYMRAIWGVLMRWKHRCLRCDVLLSFFKMLARLLYFQDPGVSTRPMPGQSEHSLFLATGMVTDGQVTQVIPLRLKSKTPSGTFMYFPLELPNSRYQPGAAGDHSWIVGR